MDEVRARDAGKRRGRLRVLVLVVTRDAEHTIEAVLSGIPPALGCHEVEILLVDDASGDRTLDRVGGWVEKGHRPFPLTVLASPVRRGCGGCQKLGYRYASERGFEVVAPLRGGDRHAPHRLPELVDALVDAGADAVLGSRFLPPFGERAARAGGMPIREIVGRRLLSRFQSAVLGRRLSDSGSRNRVFRVDALDGLPYRLNSGGCLFDAELVIQLVRAGRRVHEHPVPTHRGPPAGVAALTRAWKVAKATALSRLMDLGVLYQRRFDVGGRSGYAPKLHFDSSHSAAVARVPPGARVLDLGCGVGTVGRALQARGCHVTGIDVGFPGAGEGLDRFHPHDLSTNSLPLGLEGFTHLLLLDVVEHLPDPEGFVEHLEQACEACPDCEIIVTTPNIAFVAVRLALLLGGFNYGPRGILDLTHKRLFTFGSARRLFEEAGFRVEEIQGLPVPFPLALGDRRLGRSLQRANRALIRVARGLFGYQILLRLRPMPGLRRLLAGTTGSTA